MKKILLLAIYCLVSFFAFAQNEKLKLDETKKLGTAQKSQMFTAHCQGLINTPSADLKWRPILTNKFIGIEQENAPNQELIEKIKSEKLKFKIKQEQLSNFKNINTEPSTQSVVPVVGANWLGNVNNGMSPLDNQIAISNGGIIVSVANTMLEIDDMTGSLLYYKDFMTFINDPTINAVCDPAVIYDSGSDRFILFCQDYSSPLNSAHTHLCVFFSKTNDPSTGGWWFYKISGNPLNDASGFDYPKIAVSTNELYITGNLYYDSGGNNQSILWQINKSNGYAGSALNWQYWYNISGSPFTLLPVSYGQSGSYGPGCYLVSTTPAGASTINLYDLTDDMTGSPALNYYSVSTTTYAPTADANQLGTSCLLNTGDCRALSGFYLNGIIHFVFSSQYNSTAYHGINYNRLDPIAQTNTSSSFGFVSNPYYDYCYPSVASYATSASDKSVMIGFGRSGSTIYPEVRVVNCDDAMNWSGSTLVQPSSSYVSYTSTTNERWGDYTGTSRKHNSSTPSIWMNGMYGTSANVWNTWIAEIHDNTTGINEQVSKNNLLIYPNPIADAFNIEFDLVISQNIAVIIYDMQGNIVKELFKGKANAGINNFSFNKANLPDGSYFLTIKSTSNIIKNEKIIIAR